MPTNNPQVWQPPPYQVHNLSQNWFPCLGYVIVKADQNIYNRTLRRIFLNPEKYRSIQKKTYLVLGWWHIQKILCEKVWFEFLPTFFGPLLHKIWPRTKIMKKPKLQFMLQWYVLLASLSIHACNSILSRSWSHFFLGSESLKNVGLTLERKFRVLRRSCMEAQSCLVIWIICVIFLNFIFQSFYYLIKPRENKIWVYVSTI